MAEKATPITTSFNGGELSRRMEGRVDTAIYAIGVAEMENIVPTVEGPAMKRPGFRYIREAMASAGWLSMFIFNITQAYALEWGDLALRFYTNGGRIETAPGVAYEVATPYSAAEAAELSQQQSYDRLYLAHGSHAPRALARTSAATFTLSAPALKNGPFADQNIDEAVTVTASAVTGSVTVTASSAIFVAGHVGAPFRIEAKDFSDVKAWQVGIDGVAVGDKLRSDGRVYEAETAGRTGTLQPTHSRGSEWDGMVDGLDVNEKAAGGVKWKYLHDQFGFGTITAIGGGGTTATLAVSRRLPDSTTSVATHRWSHARFSAAAGWPRHVLLFGGRLIFFTDFEIIGSVVGDYGGGGINFASHTDSGLLLPDMAFRRRLDIADPVLWAKADRKIIIGTASGEYAIGPINSAQGLSGENIECVPQSVYRSARVQPCGVGTSFVFAQRGARKLREADYDFSRDRYAATNITVWARHITKSGVKQLAFQQEPEEMLWAVRNDGVLAAHPHAPEQEVKGFARIVLPGGGKVLSAAALPAADGARDELWALCDYDGARSVEVMADYWDDDTPLEDAFFVDSGTTVLNPASTHITGLTWLANRNVKVLADGAVVPDIVVAGDGSFDLPWLPTKFHVGRGYGGRLTPLRPEIKGRAGFTSQGKRKRIVGLVMRLLNSVGVRVNADGTNSDYIVDRPGSGRMDRPVEPFNGDTVQKAIGGNWGRAGQATIISDDPLPCMITALMPTYEISE
ncbi:MAG TPA: hypothetical protein VGW34_09985 [Allosphingosinicella sp.]|nr:hypothetical protein [Allosphingosinicella sp.]